MFERIESTPGILGGKPCIKDARISVEFILELVVCGAFRLDILRDSRRLTAEGLEQTIGVQSRGRL